MTIPKQTDPTTGLSNQLFNTLYKSMEDGKELTLTGTAERLAYIRKGLARAKFRACKRKGIPSDSIRLRFLSGKANPRLSPATSQDKDVQVLKSWLEINEATSPPIVEDNIVAISLAALGIHIHQDQHAAVVQGEVLSGSSFNYEDLLDDDAEV